MSKKEKVDITKALEDNERIELWLSKNWKKCLIFAVAVIVAAVAIFIVFYYRQESIRKNSEALAAAKGEKLEAMLKKTPDAAGADFARIRLASEFVEKKSFDKAAEQFKAVASSKSAPAELRIRARLSIAACLENSGKSKEAADAYQLIYNDMSVGQSVRNEAGFNAGRLLIALGKKADAVKLLKKVAEIPAAGKDKVPAADEWQNQAAVLLKRI